MTDQSVRGVGTAARAGLNRLSHLLPRPSIRTGLAALTVPNYRRYFVGAVISMAGTWMQTTAQAWLVLDLTHSAVALATVATLQFLPITLFTLFGGAFADRFERRRLMMVTQTLGALQALALGVLTATGNVELWHVYVMASLLGCINAVDAPLRQAFVAELVGLDRLPNAIALNALTQNLGRTLGPAVAGLVIAGFGTSTAFFVNSASFCAILVGLAAIDVSKLYERPPSNRDRSIVGDVGRGLAYARQTPAILFLFILAGFIGMFGYNFTTLVPLVATYLVNASAAQFGILNSCLGFGSFLAAVTIASLSPPSRARVLAAGAVFGVMLIAIGSSRIFPLTAMLFFLLGCAAVTFSASVNAALQLAAPSDMRGRLASIYHLLIAGSSPIGAQISGHIAQSFGVGQAAAFNGSLCCLGVVVACIYRLRFLGD